MLSWGQEAGRKTSNYKGLLWRGSEDRSKGQVEISLTGNKKTIDNILMYIYTYRCMYVSTESQNG